MERLNIVPMIKITEVDKYFSAEIRDGFFVEALIDGALSLYKFNEIFYLKKEGEVFTLESKAENDLVGSNKDDKWKGVVSYLISDCLNETKINLLGFHQKDLAILISRYNECRESNLTIFKEEKPWSVFHYGINAALINSTIKTKWYRIANGESFEHVSESYTSLDPVVGFTGLFSIPRISENYSFQLEINYLKSRYTKLFSKTRAQQTTYYDTEINLTTIDVPVYINYSYAFRNISFFAHAGVEYNFNVKANSHASSETVLGSGILVTNPERDVFEI
jgi:hypothetical protein